MIAFLTNPAKLKQYLMLLADAAAFVIAFAFAVAFRAIWRGGEPTDILLRMGVGWPGVVLVLHLLSFFVFNLYDLNVRFRRVRGLAIVTVAVLCSFGFSTSLLFFVVGSEGGRFVIGRTVLIAHVPVMIAGTVLWRSLFFNSLSLVKTKRKLALLGLDQAFGEFMAGLEWFPVKQFEFVGVLSENEPDSVEQLNGEAPIILDGQSLSEMVQNEHIDMLVCSINSGLPEHLLHQALTLRRQGIEVYDLPSFYSRLLGKIPVFSINTSWVLQTIGHSHMNGFALNLQRFVEIVGAGLLLLLTGPVFLLIAVAIKLNSEGSVFFTQERLGLYEKPFRLYKFRTMIKDAEAVTGPVWAEATDPRITKVGDFLRKTRLDELPQLINILRGDMSFVGFRPIRRHFADLLVQQIPFYSLRFSIKPGLTGWPQVHYDYAGSVEGQIEKFEYELFYLANRSPILDLFIMLKTIQVVIFGRGQ
jgi:exopolysaccharide biosynthesis polyprenyl glycosylphosphotransferase